MAHSNILKTMEKSSKRKQTTFRFPSMETDLREHNQQLAMIFHTDADIVPSYMQYYESESNKQVFSKHRSARQAFLDKYKIKSNTNGIDWNSEDAKVKQLVYLRDHLSFIKEMEFPEIDYNIIKKTQHKINNIIKKY